MLIYELFQPFCFSEEFSGLVFCLTPQVFKNILAPPFFFSPAPFVNNPGYYLLVLVKTPHKKPRRKQLCLTMTLEPVTRAEPLFF